MSKKWRLTDRTRTLLTLELAIVLPAAALLGFSVWNLIPVFSALSLWKPPTSATCRTC